MASANAATMLLKHRPPGIQSQPVALRQGLEHLDQKSVSVLRWLAANKVDFVVVGPVAYALRGDVNAVGAVAIVPAPYGRNMDRLCNALVAEHAGLRADRTRAGLTAAHDSVPVKLTPEKLARGKRWMLRFGDYDLDIEGAGQRSGEGGQGRFTPRYQELLYESNRIEITSGLSVEVASPEDLEHYSHVRRTGAAPEFRIIRKSAAEAPSAEMGEVEPASSEIETPAEHVAPAEPESSDAAPPDQAS
jgi:hypothetical protein